MVNYTLNMEQFNFKRARINIPRRNNKNKKIKRYVKKIKINNISENISTQYNLNFEEFENNKSKKIISNNDLIKINKNLEIKKELQNSELELINLFWKGCTINKPITLADKLKQQEEFRMKNLEWIKFYNSK